MNCKNARKYAALYAGGDLPERDIPNLLKHLESCVECAGELESLRRARAIVNDFAQSDVPDALPADFSQSVMDRIADDKVQSRSQANWIAKIFSHHPAAAVLAAAAVVVIFYLGVSHIMLQRKVQRFARRLDEVQEILQRDRAEIELSGDFLSSRSIEGPFPIDTWELTDTPGIFAILHKPDPVNRPDTYTIDFMGDTESVEMDYASWVDVNRESFLSRAGSGDNIYIAVYRMPGTSESARMRIAGYLINKHKPFFNDGV